MEKRKKLDKSLRIQLTKDDIIKRAGELADCAIEMEEIECQLKAFKNDVKLRIDALKSKSAILGEQVRSGYEFRGVPCEEVYNYAAATVITFRLDTGEEVEARAMTHAEKNELHMDEVSQ